MTFEEDLYMSQMCTSCYDLAVATKKKYCITKIEMIKVIEITKDKIIHGDYRPWDIILSELLVSKK